jgi:HPt (histidine-containing phosphotransfer) domain-containing protein
MATLDRVVVGKLLSAIGDHDFADVVKLFLADSSALVGELEDAAAASDMGRTRTAAHKLKSTAEIVGAGELAEVCAELELMEPESVPPKSVMRNKVALVSKRHEAATAALQREVSRAKP